MWQFFQDQGQYWDAWNIAPQYAKYLLSSAELINLAVDTVGCLIVRIIANLKFQSSTIRQEIQLNCFDPWLTVWHEVDWQEVHILAKVMFPLSFTTDYATYEIPMGTIKRSTRDPAKWEVPAQFWADMSSHYIGLAVLNDAKYGYSAKPDLLCLTALRSPQWPCPNSDRNLHKFSYRLVPHSGSWQNAQIACLAHEFNSPLLLLNTSFSPEQFAQSMLTVSSSNIILSCWKQSWDKESWIIRFYEAYGCTANPFIAFAQELKLESVNLCDLLETSLEQIPINHLENSFCVNFKPHEIKTFRVNFAVSKGTTPH